MGAKYFGGFRVLLDIFANAARAACEGSHLIVARRFEGDHAYILQQEDKRIVFAIPYEKDFTLIGTTEEAFDGDLYDVRISDSEVDYLCGAYSQHFKKPLKREDVLWSYSGVRPLFDVSHRDGRPAGDMRSASRDYILYRHPGVHAPLLSVFGGKLTTYRVLAEKVMDKLLLGREVMVMPGVPKLLCRVEILPGVISGILLRSKPGSIRGWPGMFCYDMRAVTERGWSAFWMEHAV